MKKLMFLISFVVIFTSELGHVISSTKVTVKVDLSLLEKTSSVILTMSNNTDHILSLIQSKTFESDHAKALELVKALKGHSALTQAPIRNFLTTSKIKFEPLWISNQIYIEQLAPELALTLLQTFPGAISEIRKEINLPMLPTFDKVTGSQPTKNSWGVDKVGAPQVWGQNVRGKGIIVGVIDTGCRTTHKDLVGKNVGWKDAILGSSLPNDLHGHGTHVTGTILGSNGIGMAPEANFISCQACNAATCPEHSLKSCGEYVLCPNENGGCSKKADVVSCSWGGSGGETFYDSCINAWRVAEIIPVFAMGNSGPKCGTAGSPGDNLKVIGVGATDTNNGIASFSSKGPPQSGQSIKPDMSAPGVNIVSCGIASDSSYTTMSGTSMACPHVSGMVALLLSKKKGMKYNEVLQNLRSTCDHSIASSEESCGDKSVNVWPNYIFGHGVASCVNAVKAISENEDKFVDSNSL